MRLHSYVYLLIVVEIPRICLLDEYIVVSSRQALPVVDYDCSELVEQLLLLINIRLSILRLVVLKKHTVIFT